MVLRERLSLSEAALAESANREGQMREALCNAQELLTQIFETHHGKRDEDFGTILGRGNDWISDVLAIIQLARAASGERWVHPTILEGVRVAFEECFQQLQDQQAITDERAFPKYEDAILMLSGKISRP
jgi:hypothetical protein